MSTPVYWAVIPAAGIGQRMAVEKPKQYLELMGKPIISYVINCFAKHPAIQKIVVALNSEDQYWQALSFNSADKIMLAPGGQNRCHSVLNCLQVLKPFAKDNDWVLVQDAARPLITAEDINNLIYSLRNHKVGGLLGIPVRDTLKKVDAMGNVLSTVDRTDIWQALTPQMFRYQPLLAALLKANHQKIPVTDEASAIELTGETPLMVEGRADNIKITYPADLFLAESILANQR